MDEEKKKRTIIVDAVNLMGRAQLAGRMKVSEAVIAGWVDGSSEMGDKDLLVLSKVLLDWSGKQKF